MAPFFILIIARKVSLVNAGGGEPPLAMALRGGVPPLAIRAMGEAYTGRSKPATSVIYACLTIYDAVSDGARTGMGSLRTCRPRYPRFEVAAGDWQRGLPARRNHAIARLSAFQIQIERA